ncbi:hypothetical protein GCM10028807_43290 [Spirosoma daeguense]
MECPKRIAPGIFDSIGDNYKGGMFRDNVLGNVLKAYNEYTINRLNHTSIFARIDAEVYHVFVSAAS